MAPPLALDAYEYEQVKARWVLNYPGAIENSLGADSWDEWVRKLLGD